MNRPFRTVLVGFGNIAAGLSRDPMVARHFAHASHAQVLRDHPDFSWEAVVDPSAAARERARDGWGIRCCVAALEDIHQSELDVAVLATPPDGRIGTLDGLKELKGVLVEKPLGRPGAGGGAEFAARCRARAVPVQVNFWRRADAGLQELAAGGLAARIGSVQAASAVYGNGLFNNASHLVDMIRMLLGEVAAAMALGDPEPLAAASIPGDVQIPFALRLESGATVAVQPLDFRHYREVGLDLWGETGRLTILQEGLTLSCYRRCPHRALSDADEIASDAPETLESTVGTALWRMYDNFASALRGEAELCSPPDSALRSEAVLDAVLRSASEGGRPVIPARAARL